MKKGMQAAIILLSAAVSLAIAYFAGTLAEDLRFASINDAEYALKKMNLPKQYAPAFCLHGFKIGDYVVNLDFHDVGELHILPSLCL